jgi:hypothetical protein
MRAPQAAVRAVVIPMAAAVGAVSFGSAQYLR